MTCPQCGSSLNDSAAFCGDCGFAINGAGTQAVASVTSLQSVKVEALARSSWKVLKALIVNPVEGLPAVLSELSKRERLETGLVFAGLFDLCAVIGLFLMLPRWAGSPGLIDILKLLVLGVIPPAAVTGTAILARKVFQSKGGTVEGDVFLAGVSLVPSSIVLLASGILGASNIEVIGLIAVFAMTYTVLILFAGCTQILQIATVRAIPAVPIMILIAAWFSKIAFAAMF
jgi:hypothetical protein